MKYQTLKLKAGEKVFIETPLGVITIERGSAQNSRGFGVTLPEAMTAWKGLEKMVRNTRFLQIGDDGRSKPRYRMLVPVLDEEGFLIDAEAPRSLRVGALA